MFDLIIKGGRIVDGSGAPWYHGDIGVCGDTITTISKLDGKNARKVIYAGNKVVCPGFVDMHSHSDTMILANPEHHPKVMQGVTTDLLGLDGLSYAPLSTNNLLMMQRYLAGLNGNPGISWDWNSVKEYLARLDRQVAINAAYLVPHNALRLETMGFVERTATEEELKKMQEIVFQAMSEGAVGFSTGLDYFPCRYSNTEELIAICKTVAQYGGVSLWHIRKRDLGLISSIKEVIKVAEKTNVKVHFSHFSPSGPENKGKSEEVLSIVDKARDKGLDITFDSHPYTASSTSTVIILPYWVHDGGPDKILERLKDPKTKKKICEDLNMSNVNWEQQVIASVNKEANKIYIGKSLSECAKISGKDIPEFFCDLLFEEDLAVSFLNYSLYDEEDVRAMMKHPCHTVCSDGLLIDGKPHPRGWGAFPRFLAKYCRELEILSLEEAIRHMTSTSAQRIGLSDRGLIKKGMAADIVVFDPNNIKDLATFEEPMKYPAGIDYVIVNGSVVVEKGNHTGILNGRALVRC